jgi:hypothetical protein
MDSAHHRTFFPNGGERRRRIGAVASRHANDPDAGNVQCCPYRRCPWDQAEGQARVIGSQAPDIRDRTRRAPPKAIQALADLERRPTR